MHYLSITHSMAIFHFHKRLPVKVPDSSHISFFRQQKHCLLQEAVAPMSITAIVATTTRYLVFIFLIPMTITLVIYIKQIRALSLI